MYGDDLDISDNKDYSAAYSYFKAHGLKPTPDAIAQLEDVFLPCLAIMCSRGYDPNGLTWKAEGWRGMIWKIRDKSDRLWFHGWKQGRFVPDHALDLINYAGYYFRLAHMGSPWGTRGEPGSSEDKTKDPDWGME